MVSIVVITIPGRAQQQFVNELQEKTNGSVALVVVQVPKKHSLPERVRRFVRAVGIWGVAREVWYAFLLRVTPNVRRALTYFRAPDTMEPEPYQARVIETDSVNSDEIHKALLEVSPHILVVWGSTILEPRIIGAARSAINLHLGAAPHYRGALANQHAVLEGDYSRIGATIHHINGVADGGDILDQVMADPSKSPRDMFTELNTEARKRFLAVAARLHSDETVPARTQEKVQRKVLLLRQWVPSVRYRVGSKVLRRERESVQRMSG